MLYLVLLIFQGIKFSLESELAWFLKEEVVGHKSRSMCKNNEVPKIISKVTVVQYVTAITSLWKC
jgi:hypothetical protein